MLSRASSLLRVASGLAVLGLLIAAMFVVLIPLLPWRIARIKVTNAFGTVIGRAIMIISGCSLTIEGRDEVRADRPALYVGNHTSIYDAFTSIWLTPKGTVGVAKKQIIFYPFYGQAWWLAGHLRVDRDNAERAKASMRKLGEFVRNHGLHICMWPEGTRSRDGRLLPFKKGAAHLAIQTGLPIVPMVTTGGHRAWEKRSLMLRPVPISIRFLPAIDTSRWSVDRIDEHLDEIRKAICSALPPDQLPIDVQPAAGP